MGNEVEFQIVAQADLIHELVQQVPAGASARVETATAPRELQLALETAVGIMTILVGAAQIADLATKVAAALRKWKAQRPAPALRIIVRGARDDTVIEIGENADEVTIAQKIRSTITSA